MQCRKHEFAERLISMTGESKESAEAEVSRLRLPSNNPIRLLRQLIVCSTGPRSPIRLVV